MATTGKKPKQRLYYAGVLRPQKSFASRWEEIAHIADFRPADRVLDIGCAEGLIALAVAPLVQCVHGFDISPVRIEQARSLAEQRGIVNAMFEVASVEDVALAPKEWDVTLFLGVYGKRSLSGARPVAEPELTRLLQATRRQLIALVGLQKDEEREADLLKITAVCDASGFDALGFSRPLYEGRVVRGNLLIANRRGAGARSGELPPVALVPTADLAGHSVVRRARPAPVRTPRVSRKGL
jgi:SAM-dependent methyltransferase